MRSWNAFSRVGRRMFQKNRSKMYRLISFKKSLFNHFINKFTDFWHSRTVMQNFRSNCLIKWYTKETFWNLLTCTYNEVNCVLFLKNIKYNFLELCFGSFFLRIFRFYIIVLGIGWQQRAAEWTFFCTQTFLRIETLTFGARPSLKWLPAQSVFQSGLVFEQASSRIYSLVGNETLMALGKLCLVSCLAQWG